MLWEHCPRAAAAGCATSSEYKSGLSCEPLKAMFCKKGWLSAAVLEFLGRLLPLTRTTVIYNVPNLQPISSPGNEKGMMLGKQLAAVALLWLYRSVRDQAQETGWKGFCRDEKYKPPYP